MSCLDSDVQFFGAFKTAFLSSSEWTTKWKTQLSSDFSPEKLGYAAGAKL